MTCEKYLHKAEQQRATWLQHITLPMYHVIGKPQLAKPYEFDDDNRMLYVKCADDYNSLPKKVIRAYEAILREKPVVDYIFKTDDDQQLIRPNFFENLIKILELRHADYGGQVINVDKPYISQYYRKHPELPHNLKIMKTKYCSGRFYLLSKRAIEKLVEQMPVIDCEYLEDYAIGYHLLKNGDNTLTVINIDTTKNFEDNCE